MKRALLLCISIWMAAQAIILSAQPYLVSGRVVDADTGEPLDFATVLHLESRQGTTVDTDGAFSLGRLPGGKVSLEIRYFGYASQQLVLDLRKDTTGIVVQLKKASLKLEEVTVSAERAELEASTDYHIDRTAMDHNQIVNVSDVMALLPGGKSQGDLSLMNDERLALRSESNTEKGNPAFGSAIEVDGMRIGNNAEMSETNGASTRTLSTSDIESIEIVTGIASVEHGDLSNGIVKVRTRRGKTPLSVDATVKPHTKLVSIGKGFDLGRNSENGILNANFEWARSYKDISSPYTSYTRNGLTLRYSRQLAQEQGSPLLLCVDLKGNVGGQNSTADPDAFSDTYTKKRDYALRGQIRMDWQPDRAWLSEIELRADVSMQDKRQKVNTNCNSASSQPYVHTTEQGYHIADGNTIIMGPTGYWYNLAITDSKPIDAGLHLKAKWSQDWTFMSNYVKAGVDYTLSGNNGKGLHYEDLALATENWREARYDTLPFMHNIGLYVEDRMRIPFHNGGNLQVVLGLREDLTHIAKSEYGTASSLSPRGTVRWNVFGSKKRTFESLILTAGFGKAVKLPSMQVLYPTTTYADWQTFASGTDALGQAVYAYYTNPTRALYNRDLKWQYSLQHELGVEALIKGTRISVTCFRNATHNPYVSSNIYTPFSYEYTAPLANADLYTYTVDGQTGKVTATSLSDPTQQSVLPSETVHRLTSNTKWINGSTVVRKGLEWVIDFAKIRALNTQIRVDGDLYHYRGNERTLMAYTTLTQKQSDGQPYGYVGYYRGNNVATGSYKTTLNTNVTATTHIPVISLIVSLRFECTFLEVSQRTNDRRIDGYMGYYSAVLPEYYSTWANPDELVRYPSANELTALKETDVNLYNDLAKLIRISSTGYFFTKDRISPYFSTNLNVTKEIGKHVSVSFYATNFWNNTSLYHSSATDRNTSLYESGKIPSFYYGMTLKLKL